MKFKTPLGAVTLASVAALSLLPACSTESQLRDNGKIIVFHQQNFYFFHLFHRLPSRIGCVPYECCNLRRRLLTTKLSSGHSAPFFTRRATESNLDFR